MPYSRLSSVALVATFLTVLASCAKEGAVGPSPGGEATLAIRADLSGTAVTAVVVMVTASDITTPLVFNLSVSAGVATGTITIPAGSARTIAFHAYDAGGVETGSGSMTVDIRSGTNPAMSTVLLPLTGDLPITATIGSVVVAVTPPSPSVQLSGTNTVQLAATLTDAYGNPLSGTVTWATSNPGIAVVNATGLVTGTGVGTTSITAVYHGVAGAVTVTVAP